MSMMMTTSTAKVLRGLATCVASTNARFSVFCKCQSPRHFIDIGSASKPTFVGANYAGNSIRTFTSRTSPVATNKLRDQALLADDVYRERKQSEEQLGGLISKQSTIPSVEEVWNSDPAFQSPDYFHVNDLFTVRDMFEAKVHLGHKVGSLNPRMTDFIYGSRFDSIIFDLDKTAFHLRQALNFAAHIAYKRGIIMFITRYPQTMHLVEKTAIECGEYAHCREWHTHVMTDSEKKFGGITRLPDLVILFNTLDSVLAPHRAINDANKMLIPTIGIVDSNCDPNLITYPVPGNDDSPSSVQFFCKVFKEAILRGKQKRKSLEVGSQNPNIMQ